MAGRRATAGTCRRRWQAAVRTRWIRCAGGGGSLRATIRVCCGSAGGCWRGCCGRETAWTSCCAVRWWWTGGSRAARSARRTSAMCGSPRARISRGRGSAGRRCSRAVCARGTLSSPGPSSRGRRCSGVPGSGERPGSRGCGSGTWRGSGAARRSCPRRNLPGKGSRTGAHKPGRSPARTIRAGRWPCCRGTTRCGSRAVTVPASLARSRSGRGVRRGCLVRQGPVRRPCGLRQARSSAAPLTWWHRPRT